MQAEMEAADRHLESAAERHDVLLGLMFIERRVIARGEQGILAAEEEGRSAVSPEPGRAVAMCLDPGQWDRALSARL